MMLCCGVVVFGYYNLNYSNSYYSLSELDIRENLPIIADFWVKAIFPI